MKELSVERMQKVQGGDCTLATQVVPGFWASGIGYAFSAGHRSLLDANRVGIPATYVHGKPAKENQKQPGLALRHPGYPSSAVSFLADPTAKPNGKDAAAAGANKEA